MKKLLSFSLSFVLLFLNIPFLNLSKKCIAEEFLLSRISPKEFATRIIEVLPSTSHLKTLFDIVEILDSNRKKIIIKTILWLLLNLGLFCEQYLTWPDSLNHRTDPSVTDFSNRLIAVNVIKTYWLVIILSGWVLIPGAVGQEMLTNMINKFKPSNVSSYEKSKMIMEILKSNELISRLNEAEIFGEIDEINRYLTWEKLNFEVNKSINLATYDDYLNEHEFIRLNTFRLACAISLGINSC